jgi:hypothetical protein
MRHRAAFARAGRSGTLPVMRRLDLCLLLVAVRMLACGEISGEAGGAGGTEAFVGEASVGGATSASSEPGTAGSAEAGGAGGAACALPTDPNARPFVEQARSQPWWVEIPVTIILMDPGFDFGLLSTADDATRAELIRQRQAELAPFQDPIETRLRAIGARDISRAWLTNTVFGTVLAGDVADIPCWPNVTTVESGLALSCFDSCADLCLTECRTTCSTLVGDRLDPERGCMTRGLRLGCTSPNTTLVLTCYFRVATGEVVVVDDALLVEKGDTTVRRCTAAEGGSLAPASMPDCP